MNNNIASSYPHTFREKDSKTISLFINRRQSFELIGINRVGISNFLRFYLNHQKVWDMYLNSKNHLFISVDLNDLAELSILTFWKLTLKRIYDHAVSASLDKEDIKKIESMVSHYGHNENIFNTLETIRSILKIVIVNGFLPTVFFIRFDRIKVILTDDVFNNLQGLREATNQKFMFISTSYREIKELCPRCFRKNSSIRFLPHMYLKPAERNDCLSILGSFEKNHSMTIDPDIKDELIHNSGGHVQYLQISLLLLDEFINQHKLNKQQAMEKIVIDERINLQSEEIYGNLTRKEQKTLVRFMRNKKFSSEFSRLYPYLIETGIIKKNDEGYEFFNIYFEKYLKHISLTKNANRNLALTSKEDKLYNLLTEYKGKICERSQIEKSVWPECEEIGISDWAIDRLVSRLRIKLKVNDIPMKIITVRSKGYILAYK